ncbi:MAG TPA: aminotransferase class V-fold PLP-dependent enzyme [Vicinamibacterales bacterium]
MAVDLANLEFTSDEMRRMGEAAVRRLVAFLEDLPSQSMRGDDGADALCRAMRAPAPPADGAPFDTVLGQLFDEWIPRSFNCASPGYLAFIPGGGLYPAALADFIADGVNRFTGIWQAAPALVQLEANVLDWFRGWMQFPATARGLLTTGGSMANFNAIVCARERHLGPRIRDGVLYASTQAHHSVRKSAKLAGILLDRVRSIQADAEFRMRVDELESAIRQDRAEGLVPFMVVSNAGTTNTGAVDPLETIGRLCAREQMWHHVDGAYGAFFHAVPALRPLLAGLPDADSLTLDPHKGLFLPYGTGALLVRDARALRAAHQATAGYLPDMPDADEFYDPSQHGPDLSRGFPGLRVWLSITLLGATRVLAAIAEKRELAVDAANRIRQIPHIVIDAPPQLSLFAFHVDWPGASQADQNEATRELLDRVTARGHVMLTGCQVDGRFLGRVCVLSFRTRQEQIDECVADIAGETAEAVRALGG